ncbi:MAG: acyltransferase family protein [Candidatus Helarchaeota archaeon]
MDWRPQSIRLFAIFIVIIGHMLFTTHYLINDARFPLVWLGGVAIGFFMACSGYVHGLKDEFNKSGTLNYKSYVKFFKSRFLRLYIGYYLALIVVLIAKILAGYTVIFSFSKPLPFNHPNPMPITPASLALDLTCMWPFLTLNIGGIWPEGWFICAMIILSLTYPLLRRIYSINKNYLYTIIIGTFIFRMIILICINANYAYYFPYAWVAEFGIGIILGDKVRLKGGPKPPDTAYKRFFIKAAERVWPLYLFHMAAVVFMPSYAPLKDFLITALVVLVLMEIFYRILRVINNQLKGKQRRVGCIEKQEKPP